MTQPTQVQPQFKAYSALLIGIVCIGLSAIFVKLANLPGAVSGLYRVSIAAIILVPWWYIKKVRLPNFQLVSLVALGGLFFALDLWLWNSSILITTAAKSTILANNAPLWVGLGAMIFFRERLAPNYWLGLAISLTGMVVVVGIDALRELSLNVGDLLAIAASFFYAAYLLITQRARNSVDTLTFNFIYMSAAVLILLPINLVAGYKLTGFSEGSWLALIALGLVSQLGGWLAINYALGHLTAARVSVSLLGQAVVTALVGIPVLGEILTVNQIVGGILVLGGIYLVHQKK